MARNADVRVFIGLGSNVGDRPARLRAAVKALGALPGTRVAGKSPVYETSPVGPRQRQFLNMVVELQTVLEPLPLLRALKGAEGRLGRRKRRRWGPREIDMDILYYGRRVVRRPDLVVPHPERLKRKFVMTPLAALAPRFVDPVQKRAVSVLARGLTAPDQSIRLFQR